jgi:hypothetical protein
MRHLTKLLLLISTLLTLVALVYVFVLVGQRWTMPPYFALLACITLTLLSLVLLVGLYLRYALACQRDRHRDRWDTYASTKLVRELNEEHKGVLLGYIIKNLNKADRKRLIFQTIGAVLSVSTGLLSIIATVIDSPIIHKTASAIAAIATLVLTTFSIAEFTMIHRRAGYLVESSINQWLAGTEGYDNADATVNFATLMTNVCTIIDTGETSFIGAGVNNTTAATQPIVEEAPQPPLENSWLNSSDVGVTLDNFPSWQEAALRGTPDGEDPITQ